MADDKWAARVGDFHTCPTLLPFPHSGGPVMPKGEPTVLIGGAPAARVSDRAVCFGAIDAVSSGAFTTLIGGLPAARLNDPTVHGGRIVKGCPTAVIGDAPAGVTVVRRNNVFLIVNKNTKKIYMAGVQEYYGSGANQAYVDQATKVINRTWGGPTTFEGESYTVESTIVGRLRDADAPENPRANQIEVAHASKPQSVTSNEDPAHQNGWDVTRGYQHDNDMDHGDLTPAHEFGHSMGLPDEYDESAWSKVGSGLGLTDRKTVRTGPKGGLMGYTEAGSRPTPDNFDSLVTGRGLLPGTKSD